MCRKASKGYAYINCTADPLTNSSGNRLCTVQSGSNWWSNPRSPATARRYGVQSEPGVSVAHKLTDPELNIQTGSRYLADLLRLYGGQTELALAAYNAGEGAVARAGNHIPNYSETRQYVKKVMSVYRVLQPRSS